MIEQERHSSGGSMGLDVEVFELCPQPMHMPSASLNNFLCSPVPWFFHAENGAKPCADRVSAVVGQILPSMLTLASRLAPTLVSLRSELRSTREDPLCCGEPPRDCRRAGELYASKITHFSQAKTSCLPNPPPCVPYEGGEQWQGRVHWEPCWLF